LKRACKNTDILLHSDSVTIQNLKQEARLKILVMLLVVDRVFFQCHDDDLSNVLFLRRILQCFLSAFGISTTTVWSYKCLFAVEKFGTCQCSLASTAKHATHSTVLTMPADCLSYCCNETDGSNCVTSDFHHGFVVYEWLEVPKHLVSIKL